jgi:hypothetical protein
MIAAMMESGEVDPEVDELSGVAAGQAPDERHGDGHADCGRHEVLHGKACHLHEMALGGLTRIRLPVGVRHEADGGVPGQRRGHMGGGVVEVQRQLALDELEDEQEQDADGREGEHAAGVGAPGLLGLRIGADEAIDDALTARVLGGPVHAVHVVAQRHVYGDKRDDQRCEEQDPRGRSTH